MPKTRTILVAAIVAVASLIIGAAAGYWIYSNQVPVSVSEYKLTLSADSSNVYKYEIVTMTATLTSDTTPVEGETVNFYRVDGTSRILLGNNVTDVNGHASYSWNATLVGTITFEAGYQVTT